MAYQGQQNVEDRQKSLSSNMGDAATDLVNKAGAQIDKAINSADSAARSVAQQGRETTERVQEVAGNLKTALDKSVRDEPMTTLAVAAAVGFVIGAIWKS